MAPDVVGSIPISHPTNQTTESFLEMLARDFLNMPVEDKQAILRAYASEQMSDLILQKRTIPYRRKKAS